MWLLIVGMCIQTSPVDVECITEAIRVENERRDCLELIQPTHDLWQDAADAKGLNMIFLGVGCKGGTVS